MKTIVLNNKSKENTSCSDKNKNNSGNIENFQENSESLQVIKKCLAETKANQTSREIRHQTWWPLQRNYPLDPWILARYIGNNNIDIDRE